MTTHLEPSVLFSELKRVTQRPAPFSVDTVSELWTDPYTSEQMLAYHLNEDVDLASRRVSFIAESVTWMADRFGLTSDSRAVDFGCGPGLYTSRLAKLGVAVTGVDFSRRSIAYAREQAAQDGLPVTYHQADYLSFQPPGDFDLVTMIMCDYCALSPAQRTAMLKRFREAMSADGRLVLDVYSLAAFAAKEEISTFERGLLGGFWSAKDYYGFLTSFKYDSEKVTLDKYTIVEDDRRREIYNWLQYFSVESLRHELAAAELEIEEVLANLAGHPFDSQLSEFAIVAKKAIVSSSSGTSSASA